MRIGASEFILFCNPPEENVKMLGRIVSEVELMLDGDAWDHDENGWSAQAERIKGCGIPLTVHPPAWDVNPTAPIAALRNAAAFLNKKAIEFCGEVGGSQVVFHPGYTDLDARFSKERAKGYSYELLNELIAIAKPMGIHLAFENIAGLAGTLFTQEEFIHALDGIDPCVEYLLDIGHAHINGWDIPFVIDALAGRLCSLHIHDNDGKCDQHKPIGEGNIQWEPIFAAMSRLPDSCLFTMEYISGTPLPCLEAGKRLLLEKAGH